MKESEIRDFVEKRVTPERFLHSQRVAEMAVKLSKRHGFDTKNAYLAGILHDLCREESPQVLLALADKYAISVDEYEKVWPVGLHGKVAAKKLREYFRVDTEVEEAIYYHVTGHRNMGGLARILYLADKTEEKRKYPNIEKIRSLAFTDYNKALLKAVDQALLYLISNDLIIHSDTLELRNRLLIEHAKEEIFS